MGEYPLPPLLWPTTTTCIPAKSFVIHPMPSANKWLRHETCLVVNRGLLAHLGFDKRHDIITGKMKTCSRTIPSSGVVQAFFGKVKILPCSMLALQTLPSFLPCLRLIKLMVGERTCASVFPCLLVTCTSKVSTKIKHSEETLCNVVWGEIMIFPSTFQTRIEPVAEIPTAVSTRELCPSVRRSKRGEGHF